MHGHHQPENRQDVMRAVTAIGENLMIQRAWDCYRGEALTESVGLFQQLVDLAAARGDVAAETDWRFWLGTALHGEGRLLEAAGAIAPTLEQARFVGSRTLQNRLLTRYLLICVDIPLPLAHLETAFAQVEQTIRSWGWDDTESRLPLAKGRLALYRGQGDDALRWARIAMHRHWADVSSYTAHTYLLLVSKACVLCGREDELKALMENQLDHEPHGFQMSRRITINVARAEVSRWEGDLDQALEFTRLAEAAAWVAQDTVYRCLALDARVRVLLAAGKTAEARPSLAYLLRRRHGEVTHDGFDARLLLGDFHLAEAKRLRPHAPAPAVAHHCDEAIRAYGAARRVGMAIDARLRCHAKRDCADERLRNAAMFRG